MAIWTKCDISGPRQSSTPACDESINIRTSLTVVAQDLIRVGTDNVQVLLAVSVRVSTK
jgi:hypothetical protein